MVPLFLLLLCAACEASLVTRGQWIYDSRTNARLRLRCINWYGAHQELFVVGGLEVQSVGALADLFASSGANCARIPYSVEMVRNNPLVQKDAVAGIGPTECNSTERALDVMDCVAEHLRRRNILLIFNCHTSWAGWVGTRTEQQGLWNMPGYPTDDWLWSLEVVARRYSMAGMDLRNEIHDQDGVKITWGESVDPNTDWLAASTLACRRIHAVDPEVLIIVGGLCWNLDLRPMMARVGPVDAYLKGKLVYTSHIYHWSFWWKLEPQTFEDVRAACGLCAIIAFALSIICTVNYMNRYNECTKLCNPYKRFDGTEQPACNFTTISMLCSSSVIFHVCWLIMAVTFIQVSDYGGCSSLSKDAAWLVQASASMVGLTVLLLCCQMSRYSDTAFASMLFFWLGCFGLSMLCVLLYLESEKAIIDFLGIWGLDGRPVPVWVGEFGIDHRDAPTNRVWQLIWGYISVRYDLDFAYWAFNGRNWRNGKWTDETFGLANYNYTGFRDQKFVHEIFK